MSALGKAGLMLVLLTVPAFASNLASPGECATCHPRARVLWQRGAHAREGVACVDCHRGDAQALEAEQGHHAMRRFEGPREISAVCGGCHADAARMRPYNLAADQLALYRESAHGKARLAGDRQAPVCTDCHENHLVLPAADSTSPTFAANLAQTCARCHADAALAEAHVLAPDVVQGFATSPHALALSGSTAGRGPSCANCHDTHGAAVPQRSDIDELCGACHESIRARLRAGSHRGLLEREDLAGCASCHLVHAGLRAPELGIICSNCHAEGSSQIELGGDLATLLRDAREEVAKAREAVLRARLVPLPVRDHEGLVGEARDDLRQAGALLHGFERAPIEDLTRSTNSLSVKVQREIDQMLDRDSAGLALVALWIYAAVSLGVLAHYRRRALDRGSS